MANRHKLKLAGKVAEAFSPHSRHHQLTGFFPSPATLDILYRYATDAHRSPLWLCASHNGRAILVHRNKGTKVDFARAVSDERIRVIDGICFGLLMHHLFWASPLCPPRLLTRQLYGSDCVCRPEFSIIRLKNNSIYIYIFKTGWILCSHWGQNFDFITPADSVRRLTCKILVLPQTPVLLSLVAESCGSRAESAHHLLKPYLQWGKLWKTSSLVTPDDSARKRKTRKMMSLNCSICFMPVFGVGKAYRIWTPKGGPSQHLLEPWVFSANPCSRAVLFRKRGQVTVPPFSDILCVVLVS